MAPERREGDNPARGTDPTDRRDGQLRGTCHFGGRILGGMSCVMHRATACLGVPQEMLSMSARTALSAPVNDMCPNKPVANA